MRFPAICIFILAALSGPALADGDAAAGKSVFGKCTACHSADQPKNRIGPHLIGIVGRQAAAVAGYAKYSEALKKAATDGMIWDEKTLTAYLASPKTVVPGTKMMFAGLKSEADIVNVIAYLKTTAAP